MCQEFQLAIALHWPPSSSCKLMPGPAIGILQVHADQIDNFPRLSSSKSAHNAQKTGKTYLGSYRHSQHNTEAAWKQLLQPDPTTPRYLQPQALLTKQTAKGKESKATED